MSLGDPFVHAGISDHGKNLLYGLEIARANQAGVAAPDFVSFPTLPVTLSWTDRQGFAEHKNLADDARRTYLKLLAPDVTVTLDGETEQTLAMWRALHLHPTEFYLLRLKRVERILAQDTIVYGSGANRKCTVPHSSYTLASARAVAQGWPSLLSQISAKVLWSDAWQEKLTPPHVNVAGTYDDASETLSLVNVLDTPAEGTRVYVSYTATAWYVKLKPGMSWAPVPNRSDIHTGSLTFEAV